MGKFKELYDYCQTLPVPPYIERNAIRIKAEQIAGTRLAVMKMTLDTKNGRGLFVHASNTEHPFVKMSRGRPVVAIARELNYCWERLVQTKETMHLFDDEQAKTNTPEVFQNLVSEFVVLGPDVSPQRESEGVALFMALACLCPESVREQFVEDYNRGHIDHYGIALKLRIPKHFVAHLLSDTFTRIVQRALHN
jgi:hypothetical protein